MYRWVDGNKLLNGSQYLFITGDEGSKQVRNEISQLGLPLLEKPFPITKLLSECSRLLKI